MLAKPVFLEISSLRIRKIKKISEWVADEGNIPEVHKEVSTTNEP
jgi:hypothetical protein